MKVVFRDPLACQHTLRILSGNPNLRIMDVRTEYEIAKISSHDSRLDVLAEDKCEKLYHMELQRKEELDHAMRVRFLKCEEEGKKIMCKVTDELIEIGEERSLRRIVLRMAERGKALSEITADTGVSLELARHWLDEVAMV